MGRSSCPYLEPPPGTSASGSSSSSAASSPSAPANNTASLRILWFRLVFIFRLLFLFIFLFVSRKAVGRYAGAESDRQAVNSNVKRGTDTGRSTRMVIVALPVAIIFLSDISFRFTSCQAPISLSCVPPSIQSVTVSVAPETSVR